MMNQMQQAYPAGAMPALHFDAVEFMTVAIRLAEILDEESHLLAQMNISGMAKLHAEKLRLTQMLESYQAMLRARPDLADALDDDARDKLVQVINGFSQVMTHNFQQVQAARTVNQTVVKAITDSIAEQQHLTVYNRQGGQFCAGAETSGISINLNQQA